MDRQATIRAPLQRPRRRPRAFPRRLVATERRRLAALALAATALRLVFLVTPGYDVRDYKVWARIVHEVGVGGAYGATYPPPTPWFNYPPFHLYILRATGSLYAALRPGGAWEDQFLAALLKIPPIVAEIALGFLLYRFLRRHGAKGLALGGAAAYLLNPAIIWDTAYWGGIDAFHALFLSSALFATAEGRPLRAWPLAALAVASKLLALPGALATVPPPLRAATRSRRALGRLALAGLAAIATAVALTAPVLVRGQFGALVGALFRNLGNIAVASANAHNLWWLVTWGDGWRADTAVLAFGLTYRQVGLLLFALWAAGALYGLWRRVGDPADICETGAFLTYAFFILMTEVHENWSFALFAPLAAAAALRPRSARWPLYAALSLTALANLALHDPPLRDLLGRGFDGAAHSLGLINAAAQCGLLGWWTRALWRGARFSPAAPGTRPGSSGQLDQRD